ncbi:excinuclease ABC subunit UvrA [Clavibacter michiganensis]|uniref:excinuclease ABC subunit UvrA n=1 Tax=Clavibacter michiganensis TaxID=28447 RepID=UPI001AE8B95C|nr:excinuclease ABC subunit UvrA [Clavibacter michiganensis]MBP2457242.1 excinuclease ABC subunit A [Clavibacter michiganensis]MDQ0409812.1 excinuclease ABC subunit A [Clavibacter michiganensis]
MPSPEIHPPASAPDDRADGFVRVRGASENTLRDVDVDIPRDRIVAFTGVSGSGKSSLAFGTVYAEAQRRFFESVAPYARRLIRQEQTPHVESITGLPPAVALQQRRGAPSTRSTVGTVTTLSNSLRMLMSRAGTYPAGQGRLDSDAFSPNTAAGACPVCHGLGVAHTVTEGSLVPDPSLTIREGAVAAWPGAWQGKNLRDIVIALGYDVDVPWRELPRDARDWLLFTEEQPVVQITPQRDRVAKPYNGRFWSARSYVLHTLADSQSPRLREAALARMVSGTCERCGGSGLTPEALAVTFAGKSIQELNALTLADLATAIAPTDGMGDVAVTITTDLVARLAVLVDLGLGYLSLGRVTTTLSPGEMQRLRLATQLRSGLFGVVYVLDEPSAGLHPADAEPLLEVLEQLRDSGNSVFVVEHDMDVVRRSDWIVDVGPGAGQAGGSVVYSGPVDGLREVEASATRPHLFPDLAPARTERTPRTPTGVIRATGVTLHNLVDLDVEIPLGVMVAVTGVSGSGKSTLVSRVLPDLLRASLAPDRVVVEASDDADGEDDASGPARIARVEGADAVDRLVSVDQRPIGRTPRSTLATYTGLFDAVRRTYASTDEARARGYGAGRFSFNVAGGRCETCQGEGSVTVELLFLPGSYGPCPTCHGARYEPATLEIEYHGRSIADVLGMTVDEAHGFLADVPLAARALATLRDVGLGYLRLGQPATELSGGEAQRIKLATELQRAPRGHTLYLLDEPTTGLHPADVVLLLRQLQGLVDAGNTVVVVEHEMDVVADADRVIDLGPSGGDQGGRIVAQGTPREVADTAGSRTAPYLARRLDAS